MAKNPNPSMSDPGQISRREFDEDNDAKRVVIVGLDGNQIKMNAKMDGVENKLSQLIDIVSQPLPEQQFHEKNIFIDRLVQVDKPFPVDKIVEIEKPVIVYETKIETIEKPIYIYETKTEIIEKPVYIDRIVHVDKPIIVKEYETIQLPAQVSEKFPNVIKWYLIASQIIMLGLLVVSIIKK